MSAAASLAPEIRRGTDAARALRPNVPNSNSKRTPSEKKNVQKQPVFPRSLLCSKLVVVYWFCAVQRQVYVTFGGTKKELNQTCLYSDDNMNTKKLECFDDDDSVDGKQSLSFLGKFFNIFN